MSNLNIKKIVILVIQLLLQIIIPPAICAIVFTTIAGMWEQGGSGLIAGFIAFAAWILSDFVLVPILAFVSHLVIKNMVPNAKLVENIAVGLAGGFLAIVIPIIVMAFVTTL